MEETLTLSHTIALLAYRDEGIARALSRIASNEARKAIRDEIQVGEAWKRWEDSNEAHWATAKDRLWLAVQSGRIPILGTSAEVEPTFWLTHNLDSAEAQLFRFRRSDLAPLLDEGGGGLLEACIRADRYFQVLEERGGGADPIADVMSALRSGQLSGWFGDDENTATAWTPIETRWFVLGMTLCRPGFLTRGGMPTAQYVPLRQAAMRSAWFVTEDLRRLRLIPSATGRSRLAALLTRLNDRKRRERRWVRGADLAEHFAHQRGPIPTSERHALCDEGCQQIFRSLLRGDFTDVRQLPHVRPHHLINAILRRMTPELADRLSNGRDRDGEPVLSGDLLRELMREVWLPASSVIVWCQQRNMHLPEGLATETTSLRQMLAGSSSVVPVIGMDIPNDVPDGLASPKISDQPLAADTRGPAVAAAPRMAKPTSRRKSPRQRLIAALIQLHDGGTDITHGHRDKLHRHALVQAGMGPTGVGRSLSTFERALYRALDQISARCSN